MTRYNLKRPCPKCPFRTDVPAYLTPERVTQIATDVQNGAEFYCHQTTVEIEDDEDGGAQMGAGPKTSVCAGSLILMEKAESPNQMMRIMERVGAYDRTILDMDAPVHGSWIEMQRHFIDDEEVGETCEIVDSGCEAPAGYAIGGGVVEGTEYVDNHCFRCGRACCDACGQMRADEFVCNDCIEEDE